MADHRLTNGSGEGGSPHVYTTHELWRVLVRGYRVEHGIADVPDHEDVVSFPSLLMVDAVCALTGEVTPTDVRRMLALASESWFRLETLPRYDEPGEAEHVAHWQATGEILMTPGTGRWQLMVQDHLDAGHTLRRVSLVRGPLNEYTHWKLAYQLAAGENVRVVDLDVYPELGAGAFDFWLLDNRVAVRQRYDERPRWIGAERIADDELAACREMRDRTWAAGVPAAEFIKRVKAA
jgi:hypothetical protein